MPLYRVYFLNQDAHNTRPPAVIEWVDDLDAAQKAKQFIDGKDIEVWREGYLIAKYPEATH